MMAKRVVAFAAASLIIAGSALAQPAAEPRSQPPQPSGSEMGPGMMGPGMMGHGDAGPWMMGLGRHHDMMAPGMIQAFAEGKLAFVKSLLGITEAQSGPWNAFADTVRAQAKSMADAQQKRMPTAGAPEWTLPQWLDLHLQMMQERLAAMQKVKPALDSLYQALTPEQRQKADRLVRMD